MAEYRGGGIREEEEIYREGGYVRAVGVTMSCYNLCGECKGLDEAQPALSIHDSLEFTNDI